MLGFESFEDPHAVRGLDVGSGVDARLVPVDEDFE